MAFAIKGSTQKMVLTRGQHCLMSGNVCITPWHSALSHSWSPSLPRWCWSRSRVLRCWWSCWAAWWSPCRWRSLQVHLVYCCSCFVCLLGDTWLGWSPACYLKRKNVRNATIYQNSFGFLLCLVVIFWQINSSCRNISSFWCKNLLLAGSLMVECQKKRKVSQSVKMLKWYLWAFLLCPQAIVSNNHISVILLKANNSGWASESCGP